MSEHRNSVPSDEEVIQWLREGESPKHYEVLYHRYKERVTEKCNTMLQNRTLAEEFAEDVFSKVYERLGSFKGQSSFSTWLYSITYNHCIDYLRKKKQMHYPKWDEEQEILEIPDEEEVVSHINYENLEPILNMIHPEEKAILFMKYIDDLSLRQISETLRITETATKMRLKRARTRVLSIYNQLYLHN